LLQGGEKDLIRPVAVLGKNIWGARPLIILEGNHG